MKFFSEIGFDKFKSRLSKTREKITNTLTEAITGKANIDEGTLDEIEEILISCDISAEVAANVMENARSRLVSGKERDYEHVIEAIKTELRKILEINSNYIDINIEQYKPFVILIVGVNGAGKTTSIGKLAYNFKQKGLNVVIGSADTFRAAANEQLDIWTIRAGVEIVKKDQGSDPSSVAFDTLEIAKKNDYDVVLIDTAGRLHTKTNLMSELKKINSVLTKQIDYAPNETWIVVDGNTGQNAISQVKEFQKFTEITGLIVTKLDGTAKGGALFQIVNELKIPIKYVGLGEGIEDLQVFEADKFVNAIFN